MAIILMSRTRHLQYILSTPLIRCRSILMVFSYIYTMEERPKAAWTIFCKTGQRISGNLYDAGNDRTYSLDVLPQEFPTWGTGDYRSTALIVRGQDGTTACDLRYRGYRILSGKYGLSGLPAVYGAEKEAQTLEVVLEDGRTGIQVTLLYGVLPKYDVITRSAQIINTKENIIYLEKRLLRVLIL